MPLLHPELVLKEIFYGGHSASGEGAQKMITVVAVQCGRGQGNAQKCSDDADKADTAGVVRREDTVFCPCHMPCRYTRVRGETVYNNDIILNAGCIC